MLDETAPPVMRGDLFALMDPDPSERQLTPDRICEGAQSLVEAVSRGQRRPGPPPLMDCLHTLADIDPVDVSRAYGAMSEVRRRLTDLGSAPGGPVPWPIARQRSVVLPQRRSARLVRAVPNGDGFYVLTREAAAAKGPSDGDDLPEGRPDFTDAALGPARVPPVDVTFRLFRFGAAASDIRMVMRIVQEPGTYRPVLCAGDGSRVAVMSRDVVGVFDDTGAAVLSGRVPLDMDPASGAGVTSLTLEGDILALNMRSAGDQPVELAIMNLAEKKGLPVGGVGDEASAVALGEKGAYVIDGLQLVRIPLFDPQTPIRVFRLRPWFAEYPYTPDKHLAWDQHRVWLTNGRKLIVITSDLSAVLAEIVLPEPILDFDVRDGELTLVTWDPELGTAQITVYDVN